MQRMKLCKTNLILRLRIWLIQNYHDKSNKNYPYIFQKSPVAYQFRMYAGMLLYYYIFIKFNLYLPACSIQGWFLGSALENVITSSPSL